MIPIISNLYAFQLLEYDPYRFINWVIKNPFKVDIERKSKLVYTAKLKILLVLSVLISLATLILESIIYLPPNLRFITLAATVSTIFFLPWIYVLLAYFLLRLYEIPNRHLTISKARNVLSRNKNLVIIGITGSYGKTTVKQMLTLLLSSKYKVLATPKSYNTLFGVSNIIKNELREEHEVFIVEMGAYKKGEIAELCKMVKPRIGVITGITSQHLERFGNEENIAEAKYELIESLPSDGLAVFNMDSETCIKLYEKTKIKKVGYSKNSMADVVAANIRSKELQQTFDMPNIILNGVKNLATLKDVVLNVPGEHQISNALAAVAVALNLDVDAEDIKSSLSKFKTPDHRLQFIDGFGGSLVIDDSYSSNVEGAKAAVNLVSKLTNKPKIIVTPGIVELGNKQYEENKNFGKLIAEKFDYAVVINKTNRKALLDGLLAGGWMFLTHTLVDHLGFTSKQLENYNVPEESEERVFIVDSLDEASKNIIPNLVTPGSLVLFENDLPDIYN